MLFSILKVIINLAPLVLLAMGFRSRPLVWWWGLFCLFFDWLTLAMRWSDLPYSWPSNIFVAVEVALVSVYYLRIWGHPQLLRYASVVIPAAYISYMLWGFGINGSSLPASAVISVVYIVYALLGFYRLLQTTPTLYPEHTELFWVNCALLVHAGPTCLLFLFYDDVLGATTEGRYNWWSFFLAMNIIKYSLMGVALYYSKKNRPA